MVSSFVEGGNIISIQLRSSPSLRLVALLRSKDFASSSFVHEHIVLKLFTVVDLGEVLSFHLVAFFSSYFWKRQSSLVDLLLEDKLVHAGLMNRHFMRRWVLKVVAHVFKSLKFDPSFLREVIAEVVWRWQRHVFGVVLHFCRWLLGFLEILSLAQGVHPSLIELCFEEEGLLLLYWELLNQVVNSDLGLKLLLRIGLV